MDTKPLRPKPQDNSISSLNVAIEVANLTKEVVSFTPAKAVCGSISVVLTMIRDSINNEAEYVALGITCGDICAVLKRGMNGKSSDDLNDSVREAIAQLTTTVAEIENKVKEKSGRKAILPRLFYAKNDKELIAGWKLDLNRILQIFITELVMNTHMLAMDTNVLVSDIHQNVVTSQGGTDGQHRPARTSAPCGELPPPCPRACFGRDRLIKEIIGLTRTRTPVALIGPGGIGKTSIALTILHHHRIKERFGDERRFIRCDQSSASKAHFLSRLSEVIGAGVENPLDLTPLRHSLSLRKMIIFLDNAESILDPQGKDAQEIYSTVEELSEFSNICLCLTSRISIIPATFKLLNIPVLSMEAAREAFYCIREHRELQPDLIDNILKQLDFHPLSVTLLATVARHNLWDNNQLAREWEQQRTSILQIERNRSLAAVIELSLESPMFQELGPDARELLGVIAFFPRGINEDNLDWLFPTRSHRNRSLPTTRDIFNKFCILSLTSQSNGFITMLAPLRDYLCPKDPTSSPLLSTVKNHYFHRLQVNVEPGTPGYKEAQWIRLEDVNIEHLLDVFTSTNTNSASVWGACTNFMQHLHWHKPRLVILGPKIEGLSSNNPSKPGCLFELSRLFWAVGNYVEYKRLLVYCLKLQRRTGDNLQVAETLKHISMANGALDLYEEGIQQVKEAPEIYQQLNYISGQAQCWIALAHLSFSNKQLDTAEEAVSEAINLLSDEEGDQYDLCECHRVLGSIYQSKGKIRKAIDQFKTGLGIASSFNYSHQLFWNNFLLAQLFFSNNRLDKAHTHIECAKSHVTNDPYYLARGMGQQACFWHTQHRPTEAKSEALGALKIFENLGAAKDAEICRALIHKIEGAVSGGELAASHNHHLVGFQHSGQQPSSQNRVRGQIPDGRTSRYRSPDDPLSPKDSRYRTR